ncbi:MAG: energy transducer TonB [Halioglobus sp.]
MYYQETEDVRNDRMGFAVFLAAAVHLLLIFGLTFEANQARNFDRQIKVTLATQPSNTDPADSKHIAQANQIGLDEEAQPSPSAQQVQEQQVAASHLQLREVPVLTSTSRAKEKQNIKELKRDSQATSLTGINPEVDRLARELENLEATLDDQSRAYADRPRVRRLTSVSAKRAVDAAYLHGWRARLEAVGNKYYPEASLRYGIYGELRLLVIIRQDGSLEDIQVLSSSGYAVLDEAAMKIVRLAAPFAPFPSELSATTDKLEIIRTWQFQENQLSSG